MNIKSDLEIIKERGMMIINDLPNIRNLRERATSLHNMAVDLFKNGEITYPEVRYGFDELGYNKLLEIQRESLKDYIKINSDCNCDCRKIIGDTYTILPNGENHLSWCNQAIEFDKEYQKLKEKYP